MKVRLSIYLVFFLESNGRDANGGGVEKRGILTFFLARLLLSSSLILHHSRKFPSLNIFIFAYPPCTHVLTFLNKSWLKVSIHPTLRYIALFASPLSS